jgi:hypothetical protein
VITDSGDASSPDQGKDPDRVWGTVRTVTSATAAAPVRLAMTATILASLAAFLLVGQADGASRAWSAYLAPAGACKASDDPAAAPAVQARAISCLVNWARVQDRRGPGAGARSSRRRRRGRLDRNVRLASLKHT